MGLRLHDINTHQLYISSKFFENDHTVIFICRWLWIVNYAEINNKKYTILFKFSFE